MAARYLIFFSVALLILGGAHYYVWARLVRDAALPAPWARLATALIVLLLIVLMSGFIVARSLSRAAAAPITWIGFTWLGVLFFLVISLGASDLVKVIAVRRDRSAPDDPERRQAIARIFGGAAALVGIGASGAALASALSPVDVKRVRVAIDRLTKTKAGYRIVRLIFDGQSIREEVFFSGCEVNEDVICRPVDILEAPDGSLYVSDDYAGAVYRIAKTP